MSETLYAALLAAQAEAPELQKDAINPHFRSSYVSLERLMETILPILNKHGLVLLQAPTTLEGQPALRTVIIHAKSGDGFGDTMLLNQAQAGPQAQGSAITYARRYSLMALLGLVADSDDDGNAAQGGRTGSAAAPRASSGNAAPAPSQGDGAASEFITEGKWRRLWAIAREHQVADERVKEIVRDVAGVDSTKEIHWRKYDAVIAALQNEDVPF